MIAATQGIDFHRPARSSAVLEQCVARVRERVPRYSADRAHAPDIQAIQAMILARGFADIAPQMLGP
jgi:histidine ammonia-lyase